MLFWATKETKPPMLLAKMEKRFAVAHLLRTNDVDSVYGDKEPVVVHKNLKAVPMKTALTTKMEMGTERRRSDALDHVAIALEEAVIEDNDNKAKMVRNQARVVKQLVMMEHHAVEMRPTEDVDASTNVISVSVSLATKMLEMESRKMVTTLPTVMLAGKESHAFVHATDQTRTEAVNRMAERLNKTIKQI